MIRLSCGVQYASKALFALNVFFLLIGFTVMGMGIYIETSKNLRAISEIYSMSEALGSETMQWVGVGMMIAGILTVCLAAFGCLGILKIKDH
jgi:Na+/phosphate symporter